MKILDARLTYFLDEAGKQYANSPDLELLVDRIPTDEDMIWEFEQSGEHGMFHAQEDGFWRTYFHDGSKRNLGGLGGAVLELPMISGVIRQVAGPWCGNPRDAREFFDMPHLVDVTLYEGSFHQCGIANFWITYELAAEALKMVKFPQENLRAYLVTGLTGPGRQDYDFAVMKSHNTDRFEVLRAGTLPSI